jgi:PRTRC genetic system protein C
MALEATDIKRTFKYNGMTLGDPSAGKSPDQVRMFFARQYPELLNAVVEGPVTKNGNSVYSFARAVGAKG